MLKHLISDRLLKVRLCESFKRCLLSSAEKPGVAPENNTTMMFRVPDGLEFDDLAASVFGTNCCK